MRIQYGSYGELQEGLEVAQKVLSSTNASWGESARSIAEQAMNVITASEGLKMPDIARLLGLSVDVAKVVVRPLADQKKLRIEGVKRGAK